MITVKRYIDKAVKKAIKRILHDAGVKGMKKGQHVKARDPEYVESLRGGNGGNRQKSGGMSTLGKVGLAVGGAVGGALLGRKLLKALKARKALKKPSANVKSMFSHGSANSASKSASFSNTRKALPAPHSNTRKALPATHSNTRKALPSSTSSSYKSGTPRSIKEMQQALDDPNYVFDI